MDSTTDTTRSTETDDLKTELDQLRKDFSELSATVKERSGKQFRAGVNEAGSRFRVVGREIEARPYTSLLTAFGVGLILGKVLNRRRNG